MTITHGTISDNERGIYVYECDTVVLQDVIISGNTADYNGGGILSYGIIMKNVTVNV